MGEEMDAADLSAIECKRLISADWVSDSGGAEEMDAAVVIGMDT